MHKAFYYQRQSFLGSLLSQIVTFIDLEGQAAFSLLFGCLRRTDKVKLECVRANERERDMCANTRFLALFLWLIRQAYEASHLNGY